MVVHEVSLVHIALFPILGSKKAIANSISISDIHTTTIFHVFAKKVFQSAFYLALVFRPAGLSQDHKKKCFQGVPTEVSAT